MTYHHPEASMENSNPRACELTLEERRGFYAGEGSDAVRRHRSTIQGYFRHHLRHISNAPSNRGKNIPLTVKDLLDLWKTQDGACALTGLRMYHQAPIPGKPKDDDSAVVDLVDPRKGYAPDNVRLVCYRVHQMKLGVSLDTLRYFCRAVSDRAERARDEDVARNNVVTTPRDTISSETQEPSDGADVVTTQIDGQEIARRVERWADMK